MAEEVRRAPGPDGPAGSSSGPNGSLDALGESALKIILLGDSACGKSKLAECWVEESASRSPPKAAASAVVLPVMRSNFRA